MEGHCGHSSATKCGGFLDELRNYWISEKDSAPRNRFDDIFAPVIQL